MRITQLSVVCISHRTPGSVRTVVPARQAKAVEEETVGGGTADQSASAAGRIVRSPVATTSRATGGSTLLAFGPASTALLAPSLGSPLPAACGCAGRPGFFHG